MKLKNMKRIVALGLAMMMAAAVVPASSVSAKTKYKTVKEDGKEYIVFGSYEQDGDESNGKEPIEWEVLGKDKNGILVVSRYILDCQMYNTEYEDVTWETCTLRKWLNKEFYNTAFNTKEKKKINTVKVKNADNQVDGTDGGKDTKDKIFCLSFDEILKFYKFNKKIDEMGFDGWRGGYCQDLIVPPTQNLKIEGANYAMTEETYKECYKGYGYSKDCIGREGYSWWLRSPGATSKHACFVGNDGNAIDAACMCVNYLNSGSGVRPAMYLKK